ncbi:MAG: ABC transporter permease, partial [Terriglobales bacterium]
MKKLSFDSQVLNKFGPLGALIVVYALFAVIGPPSFASLRNVEAVIRQTTIVGISALGMTLVIISGGIDLSIGSIVALVTVVIASLLNLGWDPGLAALGGIGTAMLCGLANGFLITRLKVVPFIVTLGTLLVFRGVAKGFG